MWSSLLKCQLFPERAELLVERDVVAKAQLLDSLITQMSCNMSEQMGYSSLRVPTTYESLFCRVLQSPQVGDREARPPNYTNLQSIGSWCSVILQRYASPARPSY